MRFKLILELQNKAVDREIPINYQYSLQSAIYRSLSKSDSEFSTWLHENGYQVQGKRFKLFTFSSLFVPRYAIDKERERLIVQSNLSTLYIGFLPEKSTQRFVQGVFADQTIQIADHISGAQFRISEVQVQEPLTYSPDQVFETLSPICVSERNERGYMDYLSPTDPHYEQGLLTGLLARFEAAYGKPYEGEQYCRLTVLNTPKSRLVRIKTGTPQETRVRGYLYRFRIDLPEPLMQIAYDSGLGEKGSMGFGMIEATKLKG